MPVGEGKPPRSVYQCEAAILHRFTGMVHPVTQPGVQRRIVCPAGLPEQVNPGRPLHSLEEEQPLYTALFDIEDAERRSGGVDVVLVVPGGASDVHHPV